MLYSYWSFYNPFFINDLNFQVLLYEIQHNVSFYNYIELSLSRCKIIKKCGQAYTFTEKVYKILELGIKCGIKSW